MKHDEADIAQPAYMAAQTARLAQLKASAKADDARVAAGQTERDRIQLNARTSEVEGAKLARDQANQTMRLGPSSLADARSNNMRWWSGTTGAAQRKLMRREMI